jgi:hypothetical protein
MRKRFYRKGNYTVGDLYRCLRAKKMGYCTTFIHGVADAARLDGFRYKGTPLCWPKGAPVLLSHVVGIVMKEERLQKSDRQAPAVAFILSALAEAYPCKK